MRIVLFGSGSEYSRIILEAVAERHQVVALVAPAARGSLPRRWVRALRIWRAGRAFRDAARKRGIEILAFRSAPNPTLGSRLRSLHADLFLIAAFPYPISESLRNLARLGALNVHPSLLPRHRGADPLFWTFFCDDAVTGSTVHWVVDALDAGDIVRQETIPVRRGARYEELTAQLARLGGTLAAAAVDDLAAGRAQRIPQDAAAATTEPIPSSGGWSIDFESWPAERLWHFLRGVGQSHALALRSVLPVGEVIDFVTAPHSQRPRTIETDGSIVRVYVTDGWVTAHSLRRYDQPGGS